MIQTGEGLGLTSDSRKITFPEIFSALAPMWFSRRLPRNKTPAAALDPNSAILSRMASAEFSVHIVKESLERDGFFAIQDTRAGERVLDMELQPDPWRTKAGVDLCRYVIFHEVSGRFISLPRLSNSFQSIRPVIQDVFETCYLAHSFPYGPRPGRIFSFMCGKSGSRYPIVVHLWARESHAEYWIGSHKVKIPVLEDKGEAKEPLHELARSALLEAGCKPRDVSFPNGGLYVTQHVALRALNICSVITDIRVAFERQKASMIANGFFPHHLLPKQKMRLPIELKHEVEQIVNESGSIGMNCTFFG